MSTMQKITPFLWFDKQAEEAARFYVSVFENATIDKIVRQGDAVLVADFTLDGQKFHALNGGPNFKFNLSTSFFVTCETVAEVVAVWNKLSEGGQVMMALNAYPWSEQYGWVQDRFGLSWQIMVRGAENTMQKFTPAFLFSGPQSGQAEAAIRRYSAIFDESSVAFLSHYKAGGPGPEGTVEFAQFSLLGQSFIAMDNPNKDQDYAFNEAVSFMVHCKNQAEVDYYWAKLTADGGEESMCGWLKDKFGVSWQIIPDILPKLISHPDPVKSQYAMNAMLQMRKIDIDLLSQNTRITVQATVNAPIEKVWKLWTEPEHIQQWNNASDDWHTPKASNDLRTGGSFSSTMAAKDGSFSFDFTGTYDEVVTQERIAYTMPDGRKVLVLFESLGAETQVTETFDPESQNPVDMQRAGWQAILDNFKKHAETYG